MSTDFSIRLRRRHRVLHALYVALLSFGVAAHEPARHGAADAGPGAAYAAMQPFTCDGNSLACATSVSPAWSLDGSLWLAWTAHGDIVVARSDDDGVTLSPPVIIDHPGVYADIGPDARAQIAIDRQGRIIVAYDVFKDEQWNAKVLVSTSVDGGKRFSPPRVVTDDPASQRFPSLALAPEGELFVAWIDKRLNAAAARQGRSRDGAALAYAWSGDGGASFAVARIAHAQSCECCRIATAMTDAGRPVVLFRDLTEAGLRDHALLAFQGHNEPGPLHRVAVDGWALKACPHHGPALAIGAGGRLHAAWYTLGQRRQGVFYAQSTDGGRSFSAPERLGAEGARTGRPQLLAHGNAVWRAWKSFDGQRSTVHVQTSTDAGQHWSPERPAASTAGYSDHPLLTLRGDDPMLTWLTHDEGLHVMNLKESLQ